MPVLLSGLTKPCCIECRIDPSPKRKVMHGTKFSLISYWTHLHMFAEYSWTSTRLLNQWWSVVNSISTGGNFIFFLKPFQTPLCQFCTGMSELCYLRKPRLCGRMTNLRAFVSQLYIMHKAWAVEKVIPFYRDEKPLQSSGNSWLCAWGHMLHRLVNVSFFPQNNVNTQVQQKICLFQWLLDQNMQI